MPIFKRPQPRKQPHTFRTASFLFGVLLYCCLHAAAQTGTGDLALSEKARQLADQGRWQDIVLLLGPLMPRSAGTNFHYGTALAHLDRWTEADTALSPRDFAKRPTIPASRLSWPDRRSTRSTIRWPHVACARRSVKAGPFFDTGTVTDPLTGLGSHEWLSDLGAQAKVRVFGVGVAFSCGRDLRSGIDAFYVSWLKEETIAAVPPTPAPSVVSPS